MRKSYFVIVLILAGVVMNLACGYRLVRKQAASLPAGVKSLAIPLAKNLTIEAGLEDMFTQELIKRFRADGRVSVLEPGKADAELRCTLSQLTISPASFGPDGRARTDVAQLTIECALVAPAAETVLWKSGPLAASEEFPIGDNYLLDEDVKAKALSEICLDLSESVRSLLLDAF